ncbi:uncharacterized protein LOC129226950 [Uloborus diversus]|uniref:uncharacterized protein LOC129226950 n=1 Tax=Uloborus diversus TaxID=327109 RepID=UPI00240A606D|nr:uncharacterized protein LOC129226950 [Uloborus diversus]
MPKRKSYCDGRRRSRSIGGYATNGFSELIDPSLPSDTRLQKLLEHTFEHCILVAQREFSVKDNYDSKGIECWKKIKTEIDNRALCSAAASENTSTEDFKTAEVLKSCDKEIKRYEEESRKWNSLVARLREELTEEVEATPSIIESDLDINEPLFDYSTVTKEQASILTDINYKKHTSEDIVA